MWEEQLGAIKERVAIGVLRNKLGEVWRRRAAAGGRRWVEEARAAKERSLQHHLCIISLCSSSKWGNQSLVSKQQRVIGIGGRTTITIYDTLGCDLQICESRESKFLKQMTQKLVYRDINPDQLINKILSITLATKQFIIIVICLYCVSSLKTRKHSIPKILKKGLSIIELNS